MGFFLWHSFVFNYINLPKIHPKDVHFLNTNRTHHVVLPLKFVNYICKVFIIQKQLFIHFYTYNTHFNDIITNLIAN